MRRINKSAQDISRFNGWAQTVGFRDWSEFSAPQSPHHPVYERVRDHIAINEQDCLSAYTERPLGGNIHIDHFRKRSMYPQLTFDYANFLVDDLNNNYGACFKDNSAGVTTDSFDGTEAIFYPVVENMADFIAYTLEGAMIPKNGLCEVMTNRVVETIRVFNLNHKTLKDLRLTIINIILSYRACGLPTDDIRSYMRPSGFPTLVEWALTLPHA